MCNLLKKLVELKGIEARLKLARFPWVKTME